MKKHNSKILLKEVESNEPKRETFEYLHAKPVSRRDFLSSGLIGFSSSLVLPSFLTILAKSGSAEAQDILCKVSGGGDLCPFISIKLSGGAAMSANFLPLDKGLQLLPSYSKMGMGIGSAVPVSYEFANKAPFYAASSMLAGIRTGASAMTLANANFVGTCVRSQDDSSGNKFDITGLVVNSGLSGKILPNLGKSNTETGVNNSFAYVRPPAPLIIGRYEDVVGSLGVTGSLAALSANQKSNLFRTIASISGTQASAIQNMTGGKLLARLLGCANNDNVKLISNTSSLDIDPLANATFSQAWGITTNTNKGSQDFTFATMVYNALNGNASSVNLEIGGFDYHNNTRTSGDAADLVAGTVIGKVLQSLAIMGKKGFIVVTSDGSVSSVDSDVAGSAWSSDRGSAGSTYMICYDPAGAHQVKSSQLGHFTSAQSADDTFLTGGSAELAAGAMFVNYLSFNGKLNLVESYLPRVFTSTDIDLITKIG
ncbi:MAG: hypothetical protein WA160_13995 [Pseudobdellovibrio sp.]